MKRLISEKPMMLSRDPQQMLNELASYLESIHPALAAELRVIQNEPPRVAAVAAAHDLLLRAAESIGLTDPNVAGCCTHMAKELRWWQPVIVVRVEDGIVTDVDHIPNGVLVRVEQHFGKGQAKHVETFRGGPVAP